MRVSILRIDEDGKKDILGIWIGENESAAFWTTIFNELKKRKADFLSLEIPWIRHLQRQIKLS